MISSFPANNKFILQEIFNLTLKHINMKKLFIPAIIFIGIGINANAQEKFRADKDPASFTPENNVVVKSNKELKGDKQSFSYSFDKAINKYNRSKQLSLEGQRRLAESYHHMSLNVESEEVYSKLININGAVLPEDYYNYAMVLKINGKYGEATKWMDKFSTLRPGDLRAKDYEANKDKFANMIKDEGKYKIEHLNVNSDADDFGVSYYKDKVVFASTKTRAKMIVRNYNWTGKPFWDMYVSDVDGNQLKTPKNFSKRLNGKLHDGPASFSKDGTFMAFTRNDYDTKRKDKVVELQIFFSTCQDGKWSTPVPFIFNNKEYSVGQPCLTTDGNTMYFTSDMPGGYGGADIYRTSKNKNTGEWGKPENLGANVNTEGDEMFPFYAESNKDLFFSSTGRFGLGGLDVFICPVDGAGFGTAYNAGSPLNSQYDDFAVVVNDNVSKGYFSSNRVGGDGGDDIYSFDILKVPESGDVDVMFSVNSPTNIPTERRVRETFPVRNYVFFDIGSTVIPDRYVLLTKDQVKDFKEDQLEVFIPKNLSGRSQRQMTVYYNVLNILGDRMGKNPSAKVRLSGASMKGIDVGLAMAESVKKYLVDIFGIDSSRIKTEGRIKPRIPSEQPGTTVELDLLREGDNRVSIWSESPAIMLEFQSGPDSPLKPVEINVTQEAPADSYVTFNVAGSDSAFTSWSLELKDENGKVQNFGPYTQEQIGIPGKSILGARPEGDYTVIMTGNTKSGKTIKKNSSMHIVLWTPPKTEEGLRYSVIFEFDDSKAVAVYQNYLTDVVLTKIPVGSKVIIHGYTDIIGDANHNQKLSLARANEVKGILQKGLEKANRNDVKFEVYGFGEDENLAPFENKLPEQRFYNRTVMIDIIPPVKAK